MNTEQLSPRSSLLPEGSRVTNAAGAAIPARRSPTASSPLDDTVPYDLRRAKKNGIGAVAAAAAKRRQ